MGATLAVVFDPSGHVIASTDSLSAATTQSMFAQLPADVAADGSRIVLPGDRWTPNAQVVRVPLRAPETIASVAFGFPLDDLLESTLGSLVHAQVSFLSDASATLALSTSLGAPLARRAWCVVAMAPSSWP